MKTFNCLALFVVTLAFFIVSAVTVEAQFSYETNNGTITLTGYTGPGGDVTIPSAINALPVTSIGEQAFIWCYSLASITIPSSVTHIGDMAFYVCSRLRSVAIPDSVTHIGNLAFSGCTNLTNITIPESVTHIGDSAFGGCDGLTSVTLPQSITSIGDGLFGYCFSLTNVTIPDSVTSIGDAAFSTCSKLTSITIPNSVTSIGKQAFIWCISLTSITIPNSVTNIGEQAFNKCRSLTGVTVPNSVIGIGDQAFKDCSSLTSITVESLNDFYSSVGGILFNKDQTTLIRYPGAKTGSYTVPNGVTSIGKGAFSGSNELTSITIPNTVTSIGDVAFYDCTKLTSITLPNSVTNIGGSAFAHCSGLTGAYFEGDAPSIDDPFGFGGGAKVTVYYLPGTIGWGARFGGGYTAPWRLPYPVILTTAPNIGIQTNAFGFRISWATNVPVVVEASMALSNPVWSPVSTNTLTDGWFDFSDAESAMNPTRFYRVRQW